MYVVITALLSGILLWTWFYIQDKRRKPTPYLRNYSEYTMSYKERFAYTMVSVMTIYIIGLLFYNHHTAALILALLGTGYPRIRNKELIVKRKEELKIQFKQMLYSLSSALAAGKSVENGFIEVVHDLRLLYADPQTLIIQEIEIINRKVENGEPIERAIHDFSRRAGVEDISNFANVFTTCKRTGGDLVEVIRRTSHIIGDKIEIQQEIMVMIAQKRLESRLLNVIPFVIVAFLSLSSPDYMEPLHTGLGYVIMSAALLILIACYLLTKRIMDIKV